MLWLWGQNSFIPKTLCFKEGDQNWLDFWLKFCHFQKWKYSSNILDHLSIISPLSLWSFYQVSTRLYIKMLFLQHTNFTMLTEEETCLHCTSPHSQWSQPATCSSDRQHQKIQPHTVQGFHFDITLAYPHTDLFLIFGSPFKHTQNTICWKVICSIRVT